MSKDPQIPPEVRPLGGPNTDLHKVFGGCWKTRGYTVIPKTRISIGIFHVFFTLF